MSKAIKGISQIRQQMAHGPEKIGEFHRES